MEGYNNLFFLISDLSPGCFHSAIYFFNLHSLYILHFTFLLGFIFSPTHETACQVRVSPFGPPSQELALGLVCGEATVQGWLVLTYLLQLFTQAQASYPALVSLWTTAGPGAAQALFVRGQAGNGNLLQYSCLGNPMDRGDWQATVHGVCKRVGRDLPTKQQQ